MGIKSMLFQKNYGPCSTDLIDDIPELLKYSFENCIWENITSQNSSWENIQRGAVMVRDVLLYVNCWLRLRCQKEQQEMNRSIMCAVSHIKSKQHLRVQVILEAWKWQILVSMNIHGDTWMVSNQMKQFRISSHNNISSYHPSNLHTDILERSTAQWLIDTKNKK